MAWWVPGGIALFGASREAERRTEVEGLRDQVFASLQGGDRVALVAPKHVSSVASTLRLKLNLGDRKPE